MGTKVGTGRCIMKLVVRLKLIEIDEKSIVEMGLTAPEHGNCAQNVVVAGEKSAFKDVNRVVSTPDKVLIYRPQAL